MMRNHLIDWMPLVLAIAWCLAHALLCLAVKPTKETSILKAHAASFLTFSFVIACWTAIVSGYLITMLGAISLHGAYSLSFLELWSLSQGSYSFSILDMVDRRGAVTTQALIDEMSKIGQSKKGSRIDAISGAGLVSISRGSARVTRKGRIACFAINMLRALSQTRNHG
jgi:hypothetical protein